MTNQNLHSILLEKFKEFEVCYDPFFNNLLEKKYKNQTQLGGDNRINPNDIETVLNELSEEIIYRKPDQSKKLIIGELDLPSWAPLNNKEKNGVRVLKSGGLPRADILFAWV